MKRIQRIGAALLALVLSASLLPYAYAALSLGDYVDLEPDKWYVQGIGFCLENGLMSGRGRRVKYFDPNEPVTRAQLATILWRMEGEPTTGLTMQYTDVYETSWYADAVRWAQASDVMDGYTVLEFAPNDTVTREQLALILWRYARYRNGFVPTIDDPEFDTSIDLVYLSPDAAAAMRWALGFGIMTYTKTWRGKNMLMPQEELSRATMATILMRFCLDMGIFDMEVAKE